MNIDAMIYTALKDLVLLFLAIGLRWAVSYVKAHFTDKQIDMGSKIASIVVNAVEQLAASKQIDLNQKKEEAVAMLSEYAKKVGLKLSPEQINALIEEAVKTMKEMGGELKKDSVQ